MSSAAKSQETSFDHIVGILKNYMAENKRLRALLRAAAEGSKDPKIKFLIEEELK